MSDNDLIAAAISFAGTEVINGKEHALVFRTAEEFGDCIRSISNTLLKQFFEQQVIINSKQAKIDALMLEYCPDEMTPEQLEEWEKHQHVVPKSDPRHPSNIFKKESK